jgi:hypothetical protein
VEQHVPAEIRVIVVVHDGNRQIGYVADRRRLFVHARVVSVVREQSCDEVAGYPVRAVSRMPKPLDCDVAHVFEGRAADHGDYRERAIEVTALLHASERRFEAGSDCHDGGRDDRHGQYSDGNSNVVTLRSASVMTQMR